MRFTSRSSSPSIQRWLALVVLMLPVLLVAIDNTVLTFAMPEIARDLAPSATTQLWIIDVYPLVLSTLLIASGSLGDRFGRRLLLIIGSTGFVVLSIAAAFAPSAEWLVVFRALMGVFGAAIMPATLSLLRTIFSDRNERRLAIAIWASGFSAGSAIGPLVGGLLLEHFWWGSVFLIAVPVLLPLLIFAPKLLPESRDDNPGPIDAVAIGLSMATFGLLVFGIKHLGSYGFDLVVAASFIGSVIAGFAVVRRLLGQSNPMLDVRLFRNGAFSGSVIVNLVSVLALVGFLFFAAQHLQLIEGLSPFVAALVLVPGIGAVVFSGLFVVRLVRRFSPKSLMILGLSLSGSAYVTMALFGEHSTPMSIMGSFVLLGLGVGMAETLANDYVVSSVPAGKAGAASAVSETAYELGAVLGTSILGSILSASYRSALVLPSGLTAQQARDAGETLGGAVGVADDLPSPLSEQLAEAAGVAFDSGFVTTSWIGFALMAVAIVVVAIALRHRGAATGQISVQAPAAHSPEPK
ncbi:MFS transporter [Humidisolicoccus flavus]|uniref:MFS transporter n=1 Tax=Humidisolicoccus flavus TaxID=3111414 RepID=UPI00325060A5